MGIHRPRYLIAEFLAQRAQSAAYVVVLAALLTLTIGASLMAIVEEPAPNANIKTGGDAFWWAFVTMTTVGYGDTYPVTEAGRFIGMVTMAVGVAIIGVLSSFLASWFLSPAHRRPTAADDLASPPSDPPADDVGRGAVRGRRSARDADRGDPGDARRPADLQRRLDADPGSLPR